ncbi:hypothetical protein DRO33_01100 [Candidatus Bathyarchaeota archaeon]|nr:MAG: hypothetical protein DRO33_01100 [Candidatus Bathyarchaeota archaeon]
MRRPPRRGALRALSALATLLWLLLAGFTITAIYFVAAGAVWARLSEPFFIPDYDRGLLKLIVGVVVENQAVFDLMNVGAEGLLWDHLGNLLYSNSTPLYFVGVGGKVSFDLSFCLNLTELALDPATAYLMTERALLNVSISLHMIYAYIFPTEANVSLVTGWGPPLSGLRARLSPGPLPDTTRVMVAFMNSAPFWFKGKVKAYLYGDGGLLASGETQVTAHRDEERHLSVLLPINMDNLPEHYRLVLVFDTNMFYFTWEWEYG